MNRFISAIPELIMATLIFGVAAFSSDYKQIDRVYSLSTDVDDHWDWQTAMMKIAEKLEVVSFRDRGVVVNLSEVIRRNIHNGKFEDLFIRNNVDDIMYDIGNILAGCVSEEWLTEFANSLI